MNKRCPGCGFINFVQAEVCRKCETSLDSAGSSAQIGQVTSGSHDRSGYHYQQRRRRKSSVSTWIKVSLGVAALIVVAFAATIVFVMQLTRFAKAHSTVVWQEYRPGEPGLSVIMPSAPTVHSPVITPTGLGEIKRYSYTSTVIGQGQASLCVVVFPFTIDATKYPVDKVLEEEMQSMLEVGSSTLVSKASFTEGEVHGLSFVFQPQQGKWVADADRGFGKLYLTGNRLYAVTMVARENSELNRGREKFLSPKIPYF